MLRTALSSLKSKLMPLRNKLCLWGGAGLIVYVYIVFALLGTYSAWLVPWFVWPALTTIFGMPTLSVLLLVSVGLLLASSLLPSSPRKVA